MHQRPHLRIAESAVDGALLWGAKNVSGFGSALDGGEAGRGDRSRLAGSLLVRGGESGLSGSPQKQRCCFGGERDAYSSSTEAALQPSCGQAAARLYSRSSPSSLVITVT